MIEGGYLQLQKNLYFLGLFKSLRVVSKFMDLEWCRREKNQIPPRSARTDKEFGLVTFFVFKLLSHKLLSDPSTWFSILLENEYCDNLALHFYDMVIVNKFAFIEYVSFFCFARGVLLRRASITTRSYLVARGGNF